ncbi:MAG: signal recognition particle-docking protein FtsY, partial [Nanoarchaeota archaeon]|nr:signal recognition particle-docking protein FtsY [Nanoarchaeota archaeon]
IKTTLSRTIREAMIEGNEQKLFKTMKTKKPFVFMFVGVNGVGKTTNLAKFSKRLNQKKITAVWAASDTFRAAAIQQLAEHAEKLKTRMIKHDYGSDPAAVGFDAIKHAESKGIDAVLIDTAGRSYANVNLMDELKKVKRVCKPDFTFLVIDALTGNDAIQQAKTFEQGVGVDGIIIAKSDVDRKGGVVISVSEVINKPIHYLGTGQRYEDFETFDKNKVMKKINL